jgi:hypothetical protein
MILHQLFCDIDDFCRDSVPEWKKTQLANGDKKRARKKCVCESEIITVVVILFKQATALLLRQTLSDWQPPLLSRMWD